MESDPSHEFGIEYIFGYGSLIWKPPTFVIESKPGYIRGFTRRFAQLSHDHRGTAKNPGRVVTLIPSLEWNKLKGIDEYENDLVWGKVYKIEEHKRKEVKEYLDEREKDGYELIQVNVFGHDIRSNQEEEEVIFLTKAHVYIGHIYNPSFCGASDLNKLALIIYKSIGPSGSNKEYLYCLNEHVQSLDKFNKPDAYLIELTKLVKQLDSC